ncbi:iron chelate uptake ABC transporter family permease subunit [Escherichia coli]|nr:iron chelate uptake ABC transporter family permease subunit [Escherichia coli]
MGQMIFHYSLLPRLAISLLVGAGLGLVGVLFQQVLRNPLAEPTTLALQQARNWGLLSPRSGRSRVLWRASLLRWQGLALLA